MLSSSINLSVFCSILANLWILSELAETNKQYMVI